MLSPFSREPNLDRVVAAVDYTAEEWEEFLQQFLNAEDYQVWLQQQEVTPEDFELWVKRELAIRKFQNQQWGRKVASYFLDRKHELDRVVASLIYLTDQGLAHELYFRIAEGEATFDEIARTYSQGAEASNGGRIGPVELGQLHPRLARLFYGAQLGQLWAPLKLDQWIVIARLEESLPVQFDDFMRQSLLNELLDIWLKDNPAE
ncbi:MULTISPECIES: peptidylprolyl isomerase [unclassified Leptolyngbya]|uniref:peptidylprolyl isomerase n=1 Tax=unclassified Leptolyngbya TaxID=2650499 RepID=UPI0016838176|nr:MULTISPECIES: peptidylprolyl isomerase [unclassified Leptolyngbya]MBD1911673.1 peptidylprolyl isomerase [Leptolyngbya sp. FACHB-8]MBD2155508.1 peptidylprolyl isomerase [Leptolyngbya sp. FACHB-16]